jgi:hypothetical protein
MKAVAYVNIEVYLSTKATMSELLAKRMARFLFKFWCRTSNLKIGKQIKNIKDLSRCESARSQSLIVLLGQESLTRLLIGS